MSFWEQLRDWLFPLQRDRKTAAEVRKKLSERPQLDSGSFAVAYFPEEKRTIAQRLWKITKEHSVVDLTGMMPNDQFVTDLKMDDLDSMSVVEFVIHLEKDFNISIPDGRIKEIRTFNELVDEIYSISQKKTVSS